VLSEKDDPCTDIVHYFLGEHNECNVSCSSWWNADFMRSMGADAVIDYAVPATAVTDMLRSFAPTPSSAALTALRWCRSTL